MSSFRDQLGEDWLRYQHHLDVGAPPNVPTNPLTNGVSASDDHPSAPKEVPDVLPPPLLSSESNELETESTLLGLSESTQPTESTLEAIVVDGLSARPKGGNSHPSSPDSQRSSTSAGTNQEEEDGGGGG